MMATLLRKICKTKFPVTVHCNSVRQSSRICVVVSSRRTYCNSDKEPKKLKNPVVFAAKCLGTVRGTLESVVVFFMKIFGAKSNPLPPVQNPLLLIPARQLAVQIRQKLVKSEDVIDAYIERIEQVNSLINALVIDRFELARQEAKQADQLIASGTMTEDELATKLPFLGVPITVKESFQVKGMKLTVGLVARKNVVNEEDADAVKLVKNAGAVILGVTNLAELCCSWESFNKVYGRTSNPYDTRRTSGGTSGGEASLIAAAGSVIGIGSDVAGSIRIPSMFNGIFGLKPSPGIVSNVGGMPNFDGELQHYFVAGPMCRYAEDLLPLYKVLAADNAEKLRLNDPVDLKKTKWYYVETICQTPLASPVSAEIKIKHRQLIFRLEQKHGIKVMNIDIPLLSESLKIFVMLFFGQKRTTYLQDMTDNKGSANLYAELAKWMAGASPHVLGTLVAAIGERHFSPKTKADLQAALDKRNEVCQELNALLRDDGILLCPTHPTPAPLHGTSVLRLFDFIYCALFNSLGLPAANCPLGLGVDSGLPVGIQAVAGVNCDRLCIAAASELSELASHSQLSIANSTKL